VIFQYFNVSYADEEKIEACRVYSWYNYKQFSELWMLQ